MGRGVQIAFVIFVIVAIVAIFLTFFYAPKCKNLDCWEKKLEKCSRARYTNNPRDITWKYKIKGDSKDKCVVEVEVVEIKEGLQRTKDLEGHKMTCYLPKGILVEPHADSNLCHGRLREELQTLIITKLYELILDNMIEISEELLDIDSAVIPDNVTNNTVVNGSAA